MSEEKKLNKKPLEEMDVIDNFLFTELMSSDKDGAEVCGLILSRVLKRKFNSINLVGQRTFPGVSEDTHGIRLDAYVTEETENEGGGTDLTIYDVEPDRKAAHRESLPKRSRYYGGLIDVHLLESGSKYGRLPEMVLIFILSYDPFGAGEMRYEARSTLITHPEIEYSDGVRRIYLYTEGKLPDDADEGEQRLQKLLRYIGHSVRENAVDEDLERLDEIVRKTKKRKEVGVRYMKSWEIEQELLEEGRAEGLEVGREEGREQQRMEDAETISGYQNQIATLQTEIASLQAELESLRGRNNP